MSAAGRAFLRNFVASIIILAPGILAAPDLNQGVALGIAALVASIAAGLGALKVFVPQLSFHSVLAAPYADWADAFSHGFLAAFIVGIIGLLNMPDLSTWRSVGYGVLTGAFTAGIRAIQGFFTPSEAPVKSLGINATDPARLKPVTPQL
jgi:hypothetical protein